VRLGRAAGVRYEDNAGKSEADIEALLFKRREPAGSRALPDWAEVAAEMIKPAVTLLLVWQEYRGQHPDGYSYSHYVAAGVMWCKSRKGLISLTCTAT
jgi:transposase